MRRWFSKPENEAEMMDDIDEAGPLIDAAEAEALKEMPEIMERARAIHAEDKASFSFECRRHGDFLAVFMGRLGMEYGSPEPKVVRFSKSINLGRVGAISMVEGGEPDQRGMIRYVVQTRDDGGGRTTVSNCRPRRAPPGSRFEVFPVFETADYSAVFEVKQSRVDDDWNAIHYSNLDCRVTHGAVRTARDDTIIFAGAKVTLAAPAGCGQAILDAIHAEIARGYEPKDLPR